MIGERIYSAVIEAARGSTERARIDVETLTVLRRSRLPMPHPFAYGFLLGTRGDDGDEEGCERHFREAHSLYTEMGAVGHAERVGRELGL